MSSSRFRSLSDEQRERIEPLLPSNEGRRGRPFHNDRRVVEGIVYRYRTGIPWRDLPREPFGPWQSVWKRYRRYAGDALDAATYKRRNVVERSFSLTKQWRGFATRYDIGCLVAVSDPVLSGQCAFTANGGEAVIRDRAQGA
ncbi:transposase [Saccharopolyspora shandongensis]|uniref:transposase n=1 Tax=Saccharopolyspora shandongensis TaxID=418495 RepID=UPI003419E5C4